MELEPITDGDSHPNLISDMTKERFREFVFSGELKSIIDEAVADIPDLEV